MKKIFVFLTSLIVASVLPVVASAQAAPMESPCQSYSQYVHGVDFPVRSTTIDAEYGYNAVAIERIEALLDAIAADPYVDVVAVEFYGAASPEGIAGVDNAISASRMAALEELVRSRLDISEDAIVRNDMHIAWDQLRTFVENDKTLPERDRVLEILNDESLIAVENGEIVDGRVAELRKLSDGEVWEMLDDRYFLQLRNAWFVMVLGHMTDDEFDPMPEYAPVAVAAEEVAEVVAEPEVVESIVAEVVADEVVAIEPVEDIVADPEVVAEVEEAVAVVPAEEPVAEPTEEPTPAEEPVVEPTEEPAPVVEETVVESVHPSVAVAAIMLNAVSTYEAEDVVVSNPRTPVMSIKTNILEDVALVPNLGFEFRLARRFSLDILGHYSPFDHFAPNRKVRVLAVQPELRFWWGESLVKGHFIGLHAPVAGFNVQLGDNYRYQDPNRALWGVGISYGYAMPLGKRQHWGVEFTIGFGYMNIVYDVYEGVHNGKYLRTEQMNYFGPTRLGINFSYRFNKKNK